MWSRVLQAVICALTLSPTSALFHPGGLLGPKQLRALTTRKGKDMDKLRFDWASLNFKPKTFRHVDIGRNGVGNGHSELVKSGEQAYMHAVVYAANKNPKRARKVYEITNAWAMNCTQMDGANIPLELAWFTGSIVRALELLKYAHKGAGYDTTSTARYLAWSNKCVEPKMLRKIDWLNNWTVSIGESSLALALIRNQSGYVRWLSGEYKRQFSGIVPADLITHDMTRDMLHSAFLIGSFVNWAEMLHHQNYDVYSYQNSRLRALIELQAGILNGVVPPRIAKIGVRENYFWPASYEIALNHYKNRKKLAMPQTEKLLIRKRPEPYYFLWGLGITHENTG